MPIRLGAAWWSPSSLNTSVLRFLKRIIMPVPPTSRTTDPASLDSASPPPESAGDLPTADDHLCHSTLSHLTSALQTYDCNPHYGKRALRSYRLLSHQSKGTLKSNPTIQYLLPRLSNLVKEYDDLVSETKTLKDVFYRYLGRRDLYQQPSPEDRGTEVERAREVVRGIRAAGFAVGGR
jgi:hypothetical protein